MELTVSIGDTACTITDDQSYNPAAAEDMARIARDTVVHTELTLEQARHDDAEQS